MTGNNAGEWVRAWESQMAKRGYPYAVLTLMFVEGELTYLWMYDVNTMYEHWIGNTKHPHDQHAWDIAHEEFINVDHLRPDLIAPSIALARLLSERN